MGLHRRRWLPLRPDCARQVRSTRASVVRTRGWGARQEGTPTEQPDRRGAAHSDLERLARDNIAQSANARSMKAA